MNLFEDDQQFLKEIRKLLMEKLSPKEHGIMFETVKRKAMHARKRRMWAIAASSVTGVLAAVVLIFGLWQTGPIGIKQPESTLGSEQTSNGPSSQQPVTQERDQSQPSSSSKTEPSNQKKWEAVSRAYRVQGKIVHVVAEEGNLKSITLQVTKNMVTSTNPVDFNFIGQTLEVHFEDAALDTKTLNKLQKGTEIVTAISQFALPDGKVVYGALPEWVYFVVNGAYVDLQGKTVSEEELRP